ncbi:MULTISPECIES: hypothetical protein [unclassified Sphingomonas]|uniref:hypothetical protein n=1 Tax=unclassified Sphingomonas TaxID=196159 RepID=UPI0006FE0047|nr:MULTISPECIES: hypothetical protein [unclassified Sphingomonas]KQM64691.1 hypothetical protein ASE65_15590 [Sphingomonas sp. Leaf16]KQN16823.1 hypothetical protein ASE81_15640 [Sphingomonas sp. Leaf29]KQN22806.1 hypothetical protein ASE83_15570 [Sphingomonas sp. Leaf32]
MRSIIKRTVAAVEPWYNWGAVTVERLDAVSEDHGNEGDVRFFDLQWFGLHLSFQIGRTPAKATAGQIANRARHRAEAEQRHAERNQRRTAWDDAHADYTDARARFEALPVGTPEESVACDVWVEAMARLIEDVPAPSGKALAIKVELAASRDIPFHPEWTAAIAADARRLHAEGF